jgi:DNA-binding HxlR family transcriptional regulator
VVAAEQRKPRAAAAEPMERVELNPDALAILRVMGDGRERTLGDVRARLPGLKRREYIVREMRELGVIERVEPTDSIKTYIYVITSLGRAALGMAAQEITA